MIPILVVLLLALASVLIALLVPRRDRLTVLLIAFITIAVVWALMLDLRDRWREAAPLPADVLAPRHIARR